MSQQRGLLKKIKRQLLQRKIFYTVYNKVTGNTIAGRIKTDLRIPQVKLRLENIKNLKTLLDREVLLEHLPKNSIVAEIGVDRGEFSDLILQLTSPQKLHLIDAWQGGKYHGELQALVERKFESQLQQNAVVLNVGLSTDVLATMADSYFDWVYLDTDHSYSVTKQELDILKFKVKPGGIIAGHDYISYDFIGHTRYGVIEAVNEFCVNEQWEIIYLTAETNQYRSFAIRKI
ncbi:MAG: class I SAM-dependent methyltransferase [Bacteroidota bacterium]